MADALVRAYLTATHVVHNGDPDDATARQRHKEATDAVTQAAAKLEALLADPTASQRKLTNARKKLVLAKEELEKRTPEKDNAVVAALTYPRSGESSILAVKAMDLPEHTTVLPDEPADFLAAGLFKELVQGETLLQIHVLDRDKRGTFGKFLRRVLAVIFGAVTKGPIASIAEVVVAGAASGLATELGNAIKGDQEQAREQRIGESKRVPLVIQADGRLAIPGYDPTSDDFAGVTWDATTLTLRLALTLPADLVVGKPTPGPHPEPPPVLPKGSPNGYVTLRFTSERLA